MEQLIGVVNELHDAFANVRVNEKINLPQIAVVGSQSSGKSSVLEAIVGKDFLPRGSGIVTRCPLVLQLVQLPQSNKEEWGEFLHSPGHKHYNFQEINQEIVSRTAEIAGSTTAITNIPINLKVFSRRFLNLTLVDLPGLVTNAVGDQPKDIDRQIKEMVTQYVSQENTIILAVSPANADIATSASLQIAKEIDPEGLRTVGVLTKLDLMDRGTDAMNVLTGNLLPLRHGFVGVVNRSQQEINEKKGMKAARDDEMAFLKNHAAYSAIADQHGTSYLAMKLNQLLLEHIKAAIPKLKTQFDKMIIQTRARMEKLGMPNDTNAQDNLLHLLRLFCDAYNDSIEGCDTNTEDELVGGARLDYVFNEWFAHCIGSIRAADQLTDEYIRIRSRNMNGVHATLLPSNKVFVCLSKEQILRLEEPSLKCVTHIYVELVKILQNCASQLDRFPKLREAVKSVCGNMLQAYHTTTKQHVKGLISAECCFPNIKHTRMEKLVQRVLTATCAGTGEAEGPTTNGARNNSKEKQNDKLRQESDENANQRTRSHETTEIPERMTLDYAMTGHERSVSSAIREMVEGYFTFVKEKTEDSVMKNIDLHLISRMQKSVYEELVSKLYSADHADTLMTECPKSAAERNEVAQMMDALQKANSVLENVQNYTFISRKIPTSNRRGLLLF